jgi:cytochrome P450
MCLSVCLGLNMALLEVKVLTVMLLRRYHAESLANHEYRPVFNVTLSAAYGIPLRFSRRGEEDLRE